MQFQSHVLEPSRDESLALFDHGLVSMEDHKVVCIANHNGWRRTVPFWCKMLD